ncbi:zinc finger Y-chromosomal protein 1-like [Diadema antillarum]|uniref:zinc finger Y-chromosomal protein 1-like n=1 Tax=Diadema antillarum TaxID=105358 RepID=UPI003A865F84
MQYKYVVSCHFFISTGETKNPVLNGDEDSVPQTSTLKQNEIQRGFYEEGSDQHCNSARVASNAKCLAIAGVINDTQSVDSEKTNTAPSASARQDVPAEDKEGLVFPALGLKRERCFTQKSTLTRHMCLHDPKKHFYAREQCKVCRKSVLKHNMRDHMRVHTGEKPFQCKVCSRCFTQQGSLNRHMSLHDSKHNVREQYKVCGKFVSKDHMRLHMGVHKGEKPLRCKVCSRCFARSWSLKLHMRVHTGEKPFQCKVCSICFTQKNSLKRHMSLHDPKHAYIREQCKVCGKIVSKDYMRVHMRVHTGEKPFQCKVCSRYFIKKSSLKQHMSLHDPKHNVREQCKVCLKFVSKDHMRRHMGVHKGEKPFRCKVCSRCFTQQGSLTRHMSLHDPKHVYIKEQCKVCGKSVSKDYMRVHMRVHTGEKPFQCKVCSRCFIQKSSLKQHMSSLGHMHTCDTPNPNLLSETVRATSLDVSKG